MVIEEKELSVPRDNYILIVLDVLNKFGELSARDIDNKLKDKKSYEGLEILEPKNIPSYPTICRILKFLDEKKHFVKWIQQPTKEKKYKIHKEGKMHLAGIKCEGEDYAAMLFNPQDCSGCEETNIKECWKENVEWLQDIIKKGHLGKSLSLKDSNKIKIIELLKEPSRLAQICAYYELHEQIDPFFEKHLNHFANKIKSLL